MYLGRGLSVIRVADLGPQALGLHRDLSSHIRGLEEDLSAFELTFRRNWANLSSPRMLDDSDCDVFLNALGINAHRLPENAEIVTISI